jgi:hypothetical protein
MSERLSDDKGLNGVAVPPNVVSLEGIGHSIFLREGGDPPEDKCDWQASRGSNTPMQSPIIVIGRGNTVRVAQTVRAG